MLASHRPRCLWAATTTLKPKCACMSGQVVTCLSSCQMPHALMLHARSAIGGLAGGWLGDKAARWSSTHGRIIVCQLSVGFGVPFSFLVFKVRACLASSSCNVATPHCVNMEA